MAQKDEVRITVPDLLGTHAEEMTEIALDEQSSPHLSTGVIAPAETSIELFPEGPSGADASGDEETPPAAGKDVGASGDYGNRGNFFSRIVQGLRTLWALVGVGGGSAPIKSALAAKAPVNRLAAPPEADCCTGASAGSQEGDCSCGEKTLPEGGEEESERTMCERICRIIGFIQCIVIFLALLFVFVAVLMTTVV